MALEDNDPGPGAETTLQNVLIRPVDEDCVPKGDIAYGEVSWKFDGVHLNVVFLFGEVFGMSKEDVLEYIRNGLPFDTEDLCWVGVMPSGNTVFHFHIEPQHFADVAHATQRAVLRSLARRLLEPEHTNKQLN